jgi:hypothetical protein
MREYMKSLLAQIEAAQEIDTPRYEAALKRMSGGEVRAGAICAWHFEDDADQWKRMREPMPHPMRWPYDGIIVPIPNHDGRGLLELDECIVCVLDYPIEKENPEVDWVALVSLLERPGLARFHIMETIRPVSTL